MNHTITAADILPEGMTAQALLDRLKDRILTVNQGKTALERGAVIKEQFPQLAEHTITLADQALEGLLVLPGTGPELYFVGNPPKWEFNPVNDNEYTFHLPYTWQCVPENRADPPFSSRPLRSRGPDIPPRFSHPARSEFHSSYNLPR